MVSGFDLFGESKLLIPEKTSMFYMSDYLKTKGTVIKKDLSGRYSFRVFNNKLERLEYDNLGNYLGLIDTAPASPAIATGLTPLVDKVPGRVYLFVEIDGVRRVYIYDYDLNLLENRNILTPAIPIVIVNGFDIERNLISTISGGTVNIFNGESLLYNGSVSNAHFSSTNALFLGDEACLFIKTDRFGLLNYVDGTYTSNTNLDVYEILSSIRLGGF